MVLMQVSPTSTATIPSATLTPISAHAAYYYSQNITVVFMKILCYLYHASWQKMT
nr:MAG TPA: hypothetical protein [Bacteriophage sp.]